MTRDRVGQRPIRGTYLPLAAEDHMTAIWREHKVEVLLTTQLPVLASAQIFSEPSR